MQMPLGNTPSATPARRWLQVYLTPLLFVLPMKSTFENCLTLSSDLANGLLPFARLGVLHATVSAPAGSIAPPRRTAGAMITLPDAPLRPFVDGALARSEAILGHTCNEDQGGAVRDLAAGVFAIHGPPGTGATLSSTTRGVFVCDVALL